MRKKYAMNMINELADEFDGYAKEQRDKSARIRANGTDCINVVEALTYEKCANKLRDLSSKIDSEWGADMKQLIADRATSCGSKNFHKDYIRDVERVAYRTKAGHIEAEEDFTFRYGGNKYRLNETIFDNKDGMITFDVERVWEDGKCKPSKK